MLVILALCFAATHAFHCGVDVDLASGIQSVDYVIDTKPNIKGYWVSNHEFFLFGELTSPKALIKAGFYSAEGQLRLSVTVDCKSKKWKTEQQSKLETAPVVRDEGTLNEACKAGIFDFTYELQQRRLGKFMFNGQKMEGALVPKMFNDVDSGNSRVIQLKTDLIDGTRFKAEITGDGTFTRYAYGKCIAFPKLLHRNCTEASLWIKARSKLRGEVEVDKIGTGVFGNGEYGAWVAGVDVDCWNKAPQYFKWVQSSIHADENSNGGPYCCCCYMDGRLGDCYSYSQLGGTCTLTCLSYIDHDIYDPIVGHEEE